jgi:hypothetical protein
MDGCRLNTQRWRTRGGGWGIFAFDMGEDLVNHHGIFDSGNDLDPADAPHRLRICWLL